MYKDVDDILLSSKFIKQRGYWLNKLSADIEKIELPFKSKRKQETPKKIEKLEIPISHDLYNRLMKLAKQSDLSLYIILLTALKLLIFRYTHNQDSIVVSPPYQMNISKETFNHRVFIREKVDDRLTFIELLLKVRNSVLEAYENQDYPSDTLLEFLFDTPRIKTTHIMSDIVCLLLNIHTDKILEKVGDRLVFLFERKENKLNGTILFDPRVYQDHYTRMMTKHLAAILDNSTKDIKIKISKIPFLSEEEENKFIVDFNQTTTEYPKEKTLVELFEEQVKKTPGHLAVVYKDQQLTYEELNKKSNQLARCLRAKHVKVESIVALWVERSLEMVVGLLAVLKAGGAFLPIDEEYPDIRRQLILQDSETRTLVTKKHFSRNRKKELEMPLAENIVLIDDPDNYSTESVNLEIINAPFNLAYVIYTSGTAGKPKGVLVEHSSVVNLAYSQKNQFDITEKDRVLQFSTICFDASVEQIFTTLFSGAVLVLIDRDTLLDSSKFETYISNHSITHIHAVPSFLENMMLKDTSQLKRVISGGDVCPAALARKWCQCCDFYNEYGPTETTVTSIEKKFEQVDETLTCLPIGKPINNTTIYLLDQWLKPVPFGVNGELYIGGDGVARGYLNRPELTAERFIRAVIGHSSFVIGKPGINAIGTSNKSNQRSPYSPHSPHSPYSPIYCTGDLARWLPDGNIEFLGRKDNQVKIHGFRIEPEEIKKQLITLDGIKEAIVIAREIITENAEGNEIAEKCLAAYYVSEHTIDITGMKEYLSKHLPVYMIPTYFVPLEKIPLTLNGKVDSRALPDPVMEVKGDYAPPRNETEEKLVEIWHKLLGLEKKQISIRANFFEMGGNSLKAMILVSRIHKELNVKLPLEELFKTPQIEGLASYISGINKDKFYAIKAVEKKEYFKLSSAQKRLYLIQQMSPESTAYNIPQIILLPGNTDIEKMEEAFIKLIQRHESLRTSFLMINTVPMQRVHADVEFSFQHHRVEEEQGMRDREPATRDQMNTIIRRFLRPFDLSQAPLMRIGFILSPQEKYILILDIHHIITDGTSQEILLKDFMEIYNGRDLSKLRIQYKDFSQWENSQVQRIAIKEQEKYWLKQLEREIVPLDLPTDYPRASIKTLEKDNIYFELGPPETTAIKEFALKEQVTVFMLLLAVYHVLLAKLSGQEDIIVGTGAAGRRHADLEAVIGMFVNMLPIRCQPTEDKSFKHFLQEAKETNLNAFDNQDYPFEEMVELVLKKRDANRNPLFDVLFSLEEINNPPETDTPNSTPENVGFETLIAKYDLSLMVAHLGKKLLFNFEYKKELFKKETINMYVKYYQEVLAAVLENINIQLKDIKISHDLISTKSDLPQIDFGF